MTREISFDYMAYISACIFNVTLIKFAEYQNEIYLITDIENNVFSVTSWGVMTAKMNDGTVYKCHHSKVHDMRKRLHDFIRANQKSVTEVSNFYFRYEL